MTKAERLTDVDSRSTRKNQTAFFTRSANLTRSDEGYFHSRTNWRARWRTGSVRVWSAAMASSHSLCGLAWSRSQWSRLNASRSARSSWGHVRAIPHLEDLHPAIVCRHGKSDRERSFHENSITVEIIARVFRIVTQHDINAIRRIGNSGTIGGQPNLCQFAASVRMPGHTKPLPTEPSDFKCSRTSAVVEPASRMSFRRFISAGSKFALASSY